MAAMPSLHAAFPVLSALYLRQTFGRWRLLKLGYAAIVWFAVVYMAEHWIIDVAAGVVLTMLAYALVEGVVAAWGGVGGTRPPARGNGGRGDERGERLPALEPILRRRHDG